MFHEQVTTANFPSFSFKSEWGYGVTIVTPCTSWLGLPEKQHSRHLPCHGSGSQESEIKASAGLVPSESSGKEGSIPGLLPSLGGFAGNLWLPWHAGSPPVSTFMFTWCSVNSQAPVFHTPYSYNILCFSFVAHNSMVTRCIWNCK